MDNIVMTDEQLTKLVDKLTDAMVKRIYGIEQRKARATAARAQAKSDLVGGIAEAAGAAGSALTGGLGKGGGGGGGPQMPTGLGTSTMKNYGQSFLDKTKGMTNFKIPNLTG